jgi:hypothetical protein
MMIYNRLLMIFCCLATGMISAAQVPPAPPAPRARPVPPVPPLPPVAPAPPDPFDFDFNFDFNLGPDWNAKMADFNNKMADFNAKMTTVGAGFFQRGPFGPRSSDDRLYASGQRELDQSHWNSALTNFAEVAGRGGPRADGALYWKAYALNKLNRRDEALAAIAELRKSHPGSKWLDDAGALEIEVKQASGQNVSPEGQPDEELKLMALNALVNSDPDRALPLLEGLLKGSQTPRVKERALFVLAQSSAPRAQQLLEQLARGNGNPDLQLKAIQYLGVAGRRQGNGQLLSTVYAASNDETTRRAVLHALMVSGDTDRLLQAVKAEKTPELRAEGVRLLAGKSETGDALTSMYASEQDQQVKRAILDSLMAQRNAKALVDLARKERDPETKRELVRRLSTMKSSKEATDYMLELLK